MIKHCPLLWKRAQQPHFFCIFTLYKVLLGCSWAVSVVPWQIAAQSCLQSKTEPCPCCVPMDATLWRRWRWFFATPCVCYPALYADKMSEQNQVLGGRNTKFAFTNLQGWESAPHALFCVAFTLQRWKNALERSGRPSVTIITENVWEKKKKKLLACRRRWSEDDYQHCWHYWCILWAHSGNPGLWICENHRGDSVQSRKEEEYRKDVVPSCVDDSTQLTEGNGHMRHAGMKNVETGDSGRTVGSAHVDLQE